MGREIREVPKSWKHPKDAMGHYVPLHDETYEEALAEWQEEKQKWDDKESDHADEEDYTGNTFEEWYGEPPISYYYRPKFKNADHYQMYENVSEGTPVSPIFDTLKQLEDWLVSEGHTREAAKQFCKNRSAPSFVFTPQTGLTSGIDFLEKNDNPQTNHPGR